jgi:hypothetical protein
VRIVIEFDATDGRATVTTEPYPPGEDTQPATPTEPLGAAAATDAGPPAEGTLLTGHAAAAVGIPVDAGAAPDAVGAGAVVGSEGTDAGAADEAHA